MVGRYHHFRMGGIAVSDWFREKRLEWIKESVQIFGFINREHIEMKFRISTPQASFDIRDVMKEWPNLMQYNPSTKRYERIEWII
jgi:hypothetical protein